MMVSIFKAHYLTLIYYFLSLLTHIIYTFTLHIGFVVHRGRTVPTLSSMQEPLPVARSRQSKERTEAKPEDRGKC